MAKSKEEPGVASVNRALSILLAFEDSVDGMTLTDLMNTTGLYHSTILRICESLEHFGFLKRLENGRYMLGAKSFYLGMLYQESFRLWDYAAPVLRDLVQQTHETAAIYIRENNERICLHRMSQPRSVLMHVREGERVELDKGAAGKILLAFSGEKGKAFDRIRNDGYAVSLSERESESAAIACPVFGVGQKLVCSISLGMPMFRFNRDVFDRTLPLVMQASQKLTQDLGGATDIFAPPYAIADNITFPS